MNNMANCPALCNHVVHQGALDPLGSPSKRQRFAYDIQDRDVIQADPPCLEKSRTFAYDIEQFKEGKKSFADIAHHLASKNRNFRREAVEAVGFASANATIQSTKHVGRLLSDVAPCVRQAALKSLCAVLAKSADQTVSETARRILVKADTCTKYDAIELLASHAMEGSRQAFQAIDWYHSQDKDPMIQLKAEAEKTIIFAAGVATEDLCQEGLKISSAKALQALRKCR